MYGERTLWHCDMRRWLNCPFGRILAIMTNLSEPKSGDRVRITWYGREGTMVALDKNRIAPYRVVLDGETDDMGFTRDEVERVTSEADR
jgi:hypothetical protein